MTDLNKNAWFGAMAQGIHNAVRLVIVLDT